MAKHLKCANCNSTVFNTVDMHKGKYEAKCNNCGHVTKGQGGFEVDKVVGKMSF
jgi:transcription elongation factor Elf1